MTVNWARIVFSFIALVAAYAVMPDGPWYRRVGAVLLAGWSASIAHGAASIQ